MLSKVISESLEPTPTSTSRYKLGVNAMKDELKALLRSRFTEIVEELGDDLDISDARNVVRGFIDNLDLDGLTGLLGDAIEETDEVIEYLQEDRRKRRRTILRLHYEGRSVQEILAETGYKKRVVRRILRKNT